ncbi:MAG: dienelactone hydrolase family protein [Acidobacteriota bacterium]|nr:dienelactone hydrolase family protein [Acidobacteriota bacterium]
MSARVERFEGPHQGQSVIVAGVSIGKASAGAVLVHGRGASAEDILTLVPVLGQPNFHYLAPQAAESSWYPNSFLAPMSRNEPGLSSGLQAIADALARLERDGLTAERTLLLGFSQGACLITEYVYRNPRRYGGIAVLSGAVITPDADTRAVPDARLELTDTPVFLGCSDSDPHVPKERVEQTARVFRALGGKVEMRLYPNLPHTVIEDELKAVREMMSLIE